MGIPKATAMVQEYLSLGLAGTRDTQKVAIASDKLFPRPKGSAISTDLHRKLRLQMVAELVGRTNLETYKDLDSGELAALYEFIQDAPDDILAEVRADYARRVINEVCIEAKEWARSVGVESVPA